MHELKHKRFTRQKMDLSQSAGQSADPIKQCHMSDEVKNLRKMLDLTHSKNREKSFSTHVWVFIRATCYV